jgi:uncharacterized protein (TIGR02271 family)
VAGFLPERAQAMILRDSAGQQATVTNAEISDSDMIEARLDTGKVIRWPKSALKQTEDGAYLLDGRFETATDLTGAVVIPLVAESVSVGRREVETGRVRVTKTVHTDETAIEEWLHHDEVQVERRAVNEMVEEAPAARYEGDTLVVPLVEEVLVVEKRLFLREEVRITRRQLGTRHSEVVTLRREEAHVDRSDNQQVD